MKYYKLPWTKENVDFLEVWWPHFGTIKIAEILNLKRSQIKAKVNKLKLRLHLKHERLCINCKKDYQYTRSAGLYCKVCHLAKRKELRSTTEINLEQWISSATNTARHRSKCVSDLTSEYMIELWNKQQELCYYSGIQMLTPKYGSGRSPYSPSIDRLDSNKGYLKGNVVWCIWACNAGKTQMSVEDYINVCKNVVKTLG